MTNNLITLTGSYSSLSLYTQETWIENIDPTLRMNNEVQAKNNVYACVCVCVCAWLSMSNIYIYVRVSVLV